MSRDYLAYFEDIDSGRIVACKDIKTVARRILDMRETTGGVFHYDEKIASDHIEFMEHFCTKPAGRKGPLVFEPFQLGILGATYGFVDDDGLRQFNEVLEQVGRKNGKTTKAAAQETDHLANPFEGEYGQQVYNVAVNKEQAGLCYSHVLTMRNASKTLRSVTAKTARGLENRSTDGLIRPLTSRSRSKDGLDVSFAVLDEMEAWDDRDLYDLLIQGTAARAQPLTLETMTCGFVRGGVYDDQIAYARRWLDGKTSGEKSDRFLPFLYGLDERDEWEDEGAWIKANPGLGKIKTMSFMRQEVSKAKDDPSYLPTVLVKDFNLIENQSSAWLRWDEIHNPATFDIDTAGFKYGILGIDASDTTDLTAACVLLMRPGDERVYALHMAWITEAAYKRAEEEGRRGGADGVPYDAWIARGIMRIAPGSIVDKRIILDWVSELRERHSIYVYAVGYDPWHMTDVPTQSAYSAYFGQNNIHKVRQGAMTLSEPMRELRQAYRDKRIVDNANPIAEWCRSNVMVRTDANGNIIPDKKNNKPTNRIDAFAAELDAWVVLRNERDNYQQLIGG